MSLARVLDWAAPAPASGSGAPRATGLPKLSSEAALHVLASGPALPSDTETAPASVAAEGDTTLAREARCGVEPRGPGKAQKPGASGVGASTLARLGEVS